MGTMLGVRRGALALALVLGGCGVGADDGVGRAGAYLVVSAFGSVSDASGAPIENVTIELEQSGVVMASALTDAAGEWSVSVEEGVYDVVVIPPPESIFVRQTLFGQTIDGARPLDIVLVSASTVAYTAHVTDASGAALSGVIVCLDGCVTTDASGDAAFSLTSGTYDLALLGHEPVAGAPDHFTYFAGPRELTADLTETVVLPTRVLSGQVLDDGGAPVANATVHANGSYAGDPVFADFNDSATTDASGNFSLIVFPSDVSVSVHPDAASGLPVHTETHTVVGDTSITVNLPAPVFYTAHVTDSVGAPVPGVIVCLSGCVTTDASGDAAFSLSPGTYDLALLGHEPVAGAPEHFTYFAGPRELTADLTETVVLPTRVLSGQILDDGGSPVADALVSASGSYAVDPVFADFSDSTTTDASGNFSLSVFPSDVRVSVHPDAASGLPTHVETHTVVGDTSITVSLPSPVAYTARVTDAAGAPLTGVIVCLNGCVTTDASGDAAFSLSPGTYDLVMLGHDPVAGAPEHFTYFAGPRELTADLTETVVLPTRQVSGQVVDADGNPVGNALVNIFGSHVDDPVFADFGDSATTDAMGHFAVIAFPAVEANLRVAPDPATGLATFTIVRPITGDATLAVLLQFLSDGVSEDLPAGGTASTDDEADGATPADPVETSVTSPVAGTVTVQEAPITQPAPTGYTFLTQQVNITAPASTPTAPLVLDFLVDASRLPAGTDETNLAIFRNGVLVEACTGAPGVAAPDPCVSTRQVVGDDVAITVLTSAASAWNIGVRVVVDGDGDGILDDVDACPADPEDADGFQDDDGCPDLDDDGDGIDDVIDACPRDPEDLDGFEDDDGCPEDGPTPPCHDLDGDGEVTVRDQVRVARAMGTHVGDARYDAAADLDGDGDVDVDDLHIVRTARGTVCAAP